MKVNYCICLIPWRTFKNISKSYLKKSCIQGLRPIPTKFWVSPKKTLWAGLIFPSAHSSASSVFDVVQPPVSFELLTIFTRLSLFWSICSSPLFWLIVRYFNTHITFFHTTRCCWEQNLSQNITSFPDPAASAADQPEWNEWGDTENLQVRNLFGLVTRVGQKIKIFDLGFPIRRAFAEWC